MGRPSKKEERTEEILEAFYRCVSRYGLEGSTLERVAEESGLRRSLVRHFVGNREQLESMLVDRVLEQSSQHWQEFINTLPSDNCHEVLIEGLFSDEHSDADTILVIESLIFSAGRDEQLRARMQEWMQRFTDDLAEVLKPQHPEANLLTLEAVSFGLISLYFNLDSLAPLGMNQQYRQPARNAARSLLLSLGPLGS